MYSTKSIVLSLVLSITGIFLTAIGIGIAQEQPKLSIASLNPELVQYIKNAKAGRVQAITTEGHTLGLMPGPIDMSYMNGMKVYPQDKSFGLPSFYDLRSTGKVTAVRDQGSAGSCWAHGSYGSFESCLLPGETWDFSEQNVKNVCSTTYSIYSEGFDRVHDQGGNNFMVMAYLARWSGPILESDDPYNANYGYSPMDKPIQKQILDIDILPARANATDNDNLKYAIYNYGGVQSSFYTNNSFYNPITHAYYCNLSTSTNHSIAIIGWNDNYPKTNFNITPPGNGAFIIKNSWGTSWGENGYFYMSYYDAQIAMKSHELLQFRYAAPTTMFGTIYQYDPFGWVGSYGYGNEVGWGANIFTAAATDTIVAVSTYMPSVNTNYEIYVYTNATSGPRSGTLAYSTTGTMPVAGYHTIFLNTPVMVTTGMKFSVAIRYNTPGRNYPIPIEQPSSGYSSKASAHPGESYTGYGGNHVTDDISQSDNANVCIKAFTKFKLPPTKVDSWPLYQ